MELWRRAANPWNQEVFIGISWDLMWAALIAGVVFVTGHALWVRSLATAGGHGDDAPSAPPGLPMRILRHTFSARAFHWLMAISMFALLITAFFPVVGIQFPWVTIHWLAGVLLILTVVYHINPRDFLAGSVVDVGSAGRMWRPPSARSNASSGKSSRRAPRPPSTRWTTRCTTTPSWS